MGGVHFAQQPQNADLTKSLKERCHKRENENEYKEQFLEGSAKYCDIAHQNRKIARWRPKNTTQVKTGRPLGVRIYEVVPGQPDPPPTAGPSPMPSENVRPPGRQASTAPTTRSWQVVTADPKQRQPPPRHSRRRQARRTAPARRPKPSLLQALPPAEALPGWLQALPPAEAMLQ